MLAELKLTQHDLYPDVLFDRILKQTQIHHGVMDSLMHGHVGGASQQKTYSKGSLNASLSERHPTSLIAIV